MLSRITRVMDPFDSLHMVAKVGKHSSQETLIHVGLQLTWEKERITDVRTPTTAKARSTLQSWHIWVLGMMAWAIQFIDCRCHGNGSHQVSVSLLTAYSKSLWYATLPQIFTYKCVPSISMTSCCMTATVHVVLSFLCVTLRESARDGHSGTCCTQSFNLGHNSWLTTWPPCWTTSDTETIH